MSQLPSLEDRLAGTLLGTALGDALGLPAEGMSARAIARRFGRVDRFRLLRATGYVSDDTEQSALVAQSLARHPDDAPAAVRAFRRSLVGWFFRLPFGVGMATIRACLRIVVGLRPTGVRSAGNGAAMRAAVAGVWLRERADERHRVGRELAAVTHVDARAVEGALYVGELAAACACAEPAASRRELVERARAVVSEPSLAGVITTAMELAASPLDDAAAAARLGTTGFILHTAAFATFCFLRHVGAPSAALADTIAAGGDTDSIAAIVGAWLGALVGAAGLDPLLVGRISDGPFGPRHLRALARSLATGSPPPRFSALRALARNLALFPVVLAHGFRRLVPW